MRDPNQTVKTKHYVRADYVFTIGERTERLNTNGATPVEMKVRRFCAETYRTRPVHVVRGAVVLDSEARDIGDPVAVRLYFPKAVDHATV